MRLFGILIAILMVGFMAQANDDLSVMEIDNDQIELLGDDLMDAGEPGEDIEKRKKRLRKRIKKARKRARKVCKSVGMTMDQRLELRQARRQFRQSVKADRKAMRQARKAYRQVLFDENSTIADADAAFADVKTARQAIQPKRQEFRHKVLFNVVDHSQRKKMARCLRIRARIQKMRRRLRRLNNKPQS